MPETHSKSVPAEVVSAYIAELESRRSRLLRKRIQWFCIIVIAILAFAIIGNVESMLKHALTDGSPESPVFIWSSALQIGMFSGSLIYLFVKRPRRVQLVRLLTVLMLGALVVAMPFELFAEWARAAWSHDPETHDESVKSAAFRGANAFGMYFFIACLLIPMKARESIRIAAGSIAIFLAVAFILLRAPLGVVWWLLILMGAFTLIGAAWSAWRYREFDARVRADTLREKYTNLSGETQQISAELNDARRIHEALFPPEVSSGAIRLRYCYEPMREIGGDFLFIHREPPEVENQAPAAGTRDASSAATGVPRSCALTFVLIDVSGHGIAAALAVNRLHGELQRFFSHYPGVTGESGRPGHLLHDMNTYACAALAPQGMYATALAIRLDPCSRRVEWASAGHPTAFLRRASGGVVDLGSTTTMLGVLDPATFDPASHELPLGPDDRVLAYTDGATEARDAAGAEFGAARVRAAVTGPDAPGAANHPRIAGELAAAVLAAVRAHRVARSTDDILIVEAHAAYHEAEAPDRSRNQEEPLRDSRAP